MVNKKKRDWQKLLSDYRSSGDSVRSFCQKHRISTSSFYHWLARDDELQGDISFVPVVNNSPQPIATTDFAELILPKGKLRFSAGASPDYVSSIVKSLV